MEERTRRAAGAGIAERLQGAPIETARLAQPHPTTLNMRMIP